MDVEKFQSLLESEYESRLDIYIKNDYVEDDDICDCGYTANTNVSGTMKTILYSKRTKICR